METAGPADSDITMLLMQGNKTSKPRHQLFRRKMLLIPRYGVRTLFVRGMVVVAFQLSAWKFWGMWL